MAQLGSTNIYGNLSVTGTTTSSSGFIGNVTGDVSGNAGTATKLKTARSLKITDDGTNTSTGVDFDGSDAVTLKLPSTIKASLAGNVSGSSGSCTGNAATSSKLKTARSLKITDGTNTSTGVNFDGSADATLNLPSTIKATFLGNLTGDVTGNAASATKATQDGLGNVIADVYATKTELGAKNVGIATATGSGNAITSLSANGNVITPDKGATFLTSYNVGNGLFEGDLNTATTSGFYRINDGQANSPGAYGQLIVCHGAHDTITQIYGEYSNGSLYTRSGNPSNVGGSGSWGSWKRLWMAGDAVTGAVWNDLIDCIDIPEGDILEPGYCYCMHEDGHYHKSEKYLDSRYIGIDSDTYSLAMGMEIGKRKLNAAVAGFVLAYVDKEYPIGTALTCTENGVLTEIKKEDKCYNPEMIIAKYWKNEEREEIVREDKTVGVNGRKWVKIV